MPVALHGRYATLQLVHVHEVNGKIQFVQKLARLESLHLKSRRPASINLSLAASERGGDEYNKTKTHTHTRLCASRPACMVDASFSSTINSKLRALRRYYHKTITRSATTCATDRLPGTACDTRPCDVVEGKVKVLQLLHVVQILHLPDDVVLKVEDLEPTAVAAEGVVDRLQFFLCGRHAATNAHPI